MSLETTKDVPKHTLLSKAREQIMSEFELKESTLKLIENQIAQEPYCMVRTRDGSKPSTRWSRTVEDLWKWNNAVPDAKGFKKFNPYLSLQGQTFNRRDIMKQPIFRADLFNLISEQIRSIDDYTRCYKQIVWRYDHDSGEEYETMLIQVPV